MRIKCPECESVLSLGQPKAGRYRPKCKKCGKPFRLVVSEDDPPKLSVAREKPAKANVGGESASRKKVVTAASAAEKVGAAGGAGAARAASAAEATLPGAGATMPDSDAADAAATMPGASATMPGADVTVPGTETTMAESPGATEATIAGDAPIAHDSSHAAVDATVDQAAPEATRDTAVQATLDTSPGGGRAAQTIGQVEATVDGTIEGSSSGGSGSVSVGGSKSPVVSAGASAPVRAGKSAPKSSSDDSQVPEKLGGYRIIRVLGRGAMGAVYEAKQISLDRLVALKTIRGRLAGNASSLARFTREAYAAAQLTHHNVVQIYDFGEDAGKHFFSMEWVRGGPLSDLVQEKGAIDPRLAAGYTLQAARGLQFAHQNGMVHRDVKPANLLLSDEGIVKVADLGLVKIPDQMDPESDVGASSMSGLESGTQVTMQGTAVGTPAYMAPEQGVDAAAVDHRADIYSLGCTLFYLLSGKPPFDGSVVSEVLQQHAKQPLPSLVKINSRVPDALEKVVERSMAKRPQDRYQSLVELIEDLETYLGVNSEGKFSPSSQQADQWEKLAAEYSRASGMLALTKPMLLGFTAVCALLSVVAPFFGLGWLLLGPTLFISGILTALALGGRRSPVVATFRRWMGSLSWFDYMVAVLGSVILVLVCLVAGLAIGVLVGVILGAVAGAAYHFAVVAPVRKKCAATVQKAERFIRDLRIDGADEDGVRMFMARYGGKKWQGLFETLFGYDALCKVRDQLKGDPSFSAGRVTLRDRICASLSGKADANKQARDHKRLATIEQRGLQSEGLSADEARDRAWQMAAAVMDNARAVPQANSDAEAAAEAKRARMKAMLADARSGKYAKKRDKFAVARFAMGGQTRLLAGCLLLAYFAIWAQQSGTVDQARAIFEARDVGGLFTLLGSEAGNHFAVGVAGLLLAMSSFVSGWRMTPFAAVATIVILLGPSLGIPGLGDLLQPWMVATLVGLAIYVPGILFGEKKEF